MSLEDFQLLDNEPFDNSIIKRDFLKVYYQQGAQLSQSDQSIEFVFVEKNKYHQIGNGFLQFAITVRKNASASFHYDDPIRLVHKGFAICFKEARLSTTIGSDIEHNNFCGQVSTFIKVIRDKDGDLFFQFDNFNDNDILVLERLADLPQQFRSTPHQQMLINKHTDANEGEIKAVLYLEDNFGFCKSFQKVTKILGFNLIFETADLQDIITTFITDDKNVTITNLYLYIPNLKPSVETQLRFNEATQNNYRISFDEWYTERRIISDIIVQVDIGPAQPVISAKHLFPAYQTQLRKKRI